MGDSKSKNPRSDPIVPGIEGCLQCLQRKNDQRLDGSAIEDVRETSTSNRIFLIKNLLNLNIGDSESVVGHLNEFNMLTSQLKSVEINFEDEIRALVLLSSLSEAWDGLMVTVSNFCGTRTLKFDDVVGVLLSEEKHRKSSGSAKTSRSVLSVNQRERFENRDKKRIGG